MITTEELACIRAAAVGDMLGDSKALDEMGPAATVFRLCRELERMDREADWLAIKLNKIASPCMTLFPCEGSLPCNYPHGEPHCWRDKAAYEAVEGGDGRVRADGKGKGVVG